MENQKSEEKIVIEALKRHWREQLKIIRHEIGSYRRKEASTRACEDLNKLTKKSHFILSFSSFGSEIDLWPYHAILAKEGRLVLPRLVDRELQLYRVQSFDHLELHRWGFLEPHPSFCERIDSLEIDVALIPGLGFDPATNIRIGYGGGHYDRFMTKNEVSQMWGIGFHEQLVYGLPFDTHDRPLNKVYVF